MEEIEKLANEARDSVGDFCANECHSFCCRKGYLPVSEEEANLICGKNKEKFILNGIFEEKWNGKFFLNFENNPDGCPALKDFKCLIHSEDKRPQTCKDFPIFILNKKIKISDRCPAKKEGKFFKFEKDVKKLGYEFVNCLID